MQARTGTDDSTMAEKDGSSKTTSGENLPISPITLPCPVCGAKPGHDCETPSKVRLYVVHLARIKAAAEMDKSKKV